MKRLVFFGIFIITTSLITACTIFSSGDPTKITRLKGHDVTGIFANGNRIIAGTEKGIFLSTDNGKNWILADSTVHLNNFFIPNNMSPPPIQITIWGDDNTIFAGIEGGESAGVLVSSDNGDTWKQKDTNFIEEVNGGFTQIGSTIFVGTNHGVFFTTNEGSRWKAAADTSKIHPVFSVFSIGSVLFAGVPDEGVFRSTDKGKTWSTANNGLTNTATLAFTALNSKLFVGVRQATDTSTAGVFVSKDNGANWNPLDNKLTSHTINVLYSNDKTLFAGTKRGIYFSADQGNKWNLFDSIYATSFASNDSYLFIGTNGGIKRYPLSQFN